MECSVKLNTANDILELLESSVASAALGAAIELGLFWKLEFQPMNEQEIASALGIPRRRCAYWLQVLQNLNLLDLETTGYSPSSTARSCILQVYGQDSWALLAAEARERLPAFFNLAQNLKHPGSEKNATSLRYSSYISAMEKDPEHARRFTRMLFEIHQPLAQDMAEHLNLDGIKQLMDIGGGSGVISRALLELHPELKATVIEIASVCTAGRKLAAENSLQDRITFYAADFLRDDLPRGFDLVLECDVNIYGLELFSKIRDSLNPHGRFVIVDQFAPEQGVAPPDRLHWAFENSMINPEFVFPTAGEVCGQLESAGFQILSMAALPSTSGTQKSLREKFSVIEAWKKA
jgi:predicted TPR repeat methyltransferase